MLQAASEGSQEELDALFSVVYDELRHLARKVRTGRASDTLNTTALVHEAYLKLVPSTGVEWHDRVHFYRVAARAMRQILVSKARARMAEKRGGKGFAVTFEAAAYAAPLRSDDFLALDEALTQLADLDPRQAQMVEYRFFAGLTLEETAHALGLSSMTVKRDWRAARAWLAHTLRAA